MAKIKGTGVLHDCLQVKEPDMDSLATLTRKAMGSRSINGFADICGVAPSTISRILNKRLTKKIADDVIVTILLNAENPSPELLKEFLDAQGLALPAGETAKSFFGHIKNFGVPPRSTPRRIYILDEPKKGSDEETIRRILQSALIDHGYSVAKAESNDQFQPDFCYEVSGEVMGFWYCKTPSFEKMGAHGFFYPGAMSHLSIITSDRNAYQQCIKTAGEFRWGDNNVSILLAKDNGIEEYVVNGKGILSQ